MFLFGERQSKYVQDSSKLLRNRRPMFGCFRNMERNVISKHRCSCITKLLIFFIKAFFFFFFAFR